MPVLELLDICKSFDKGPVLKGVSLSVERGEACAIVGPSGEGKTTLLKCANLLLQMDSGEVRFDGAVAARRQPRDASVTVLRDPSTLRRRLGMVFQEWNLWPNMTVLENMILAQRYALGRSQEHATQIALSLAERVRISPQIHAFPHSLSGGQKQRAAIARALAMDPEVLMLDEVTSALDPVLAAGVLDVMRDLKSEGRTLVLVTHYIDFARAVADKIVFLHDGRAHETGPASILDTPATPEFRWFLDQVRRVH